MNSFLYLSLESQSWEQQYKTITALLRAKTVLTMQMIGVLILPCVQVEAGAQVIITQLFYDVEKFIKFTQDCRALGIECPIIPGQITLTVITLLAWIQTSKVCCRVPLGL